MTTSAVARPRSFCPVCRHEMAARNLSRHRAIPHDVQCPICELWLPAALKGSNHKQITIRTHMKTAHGVGLRAWKTQQPRQRKTRTIRPRTQPQPRRATIAPRQGVTPPRALLTPLERQRNRLAGTIRRMDDSPRREAARLRLVEIAYHAWHERSMA